MPIAAILMPVVLPIVKLFAARIRERIKAKRKGRQVRRVTVDYKDLSELVKAAAGNAYSRTTGQVDEVRMIQEANGIDQLVSNQDNLRVLKQIRDLLIHNNTVGAK